VVVRRKWVNGMTNERADENTKAPTVALHGERPAVAQKRPGCGIAGKGFRWLKQNLIYQENIN
jgi:hypothetical protein